MTKAISERELVLGILMEITKENAYSHIVLHRVLDKYQYLDKKERSFITRVVTGTLEHMIELDYIIDQFSKVKVQKMKPVIRAILRSAVYQLKYMDNVPDSAVCNEAVKLAVKKGFASLRGFVNGVLRNIARNLEHISYPSMEAEMPYLSVKYSMPEWILEMWLKIYDRSTVELMLQDFLAEKPTTIRVNPMKATQEELAVKLQKQGITVVKHPYLTDALLISGYDYLNAIPEFVEGAFSVQDISSMLAGEITAPKAQDYVIDVCAAPGGKAMHVAERLAGTGHVEARDLTAYKVEMIQENIRRAGLTNIEAIQQDALVKDEQSVGKADIVIADLPCSGLGVLGRKTEIKYRVTPADVKALAELQRSILGVVQSYVKEGGALIYSTCTISPAENIEIAHWFQKEYPEFSPENISGLLCQELQESVHEKGCLQLLPGVHQSDGFFIAKFRRNQTVIEE